MALKKTSAEEAREQAEEAALGSMLDGAFGAMEGIESTPHHRDHLVHLDLQDHHQDRQVLLQDHLKALQAMAHPGLQRDLHRAHPPDHQKGHLKTPQRILPLLRRAQLKSQNLLLSTSQKRPRKVLYKKNQNPFKMNQ